MIYATLTCPHCGSDQKLECEDLAEAGLITYWGDEPLKCVECSECETEFKVKESVSRLWLVAE